MTFGEMVKALREAQHLTQEDLAAFMGMPKDVGRVTVAQWETGARRTPRERMPKLIACLSYWPFGPDMPTDVRRELVERALLSATYEGDAG